MFRILLLVGVFALVAMFTPVSGYAAEDLLPRADTATDETTKSTKKSTKKNAKEKASKLRVRKECAVPALLANNR
jgi:hypothetical protein|tara:strand:+ start:139 stop:363 length:225 start_codon:yes stop_codon:yes gene_type:complete